jgi:hypothetical protein
MYSLTKGMIKFQFMLLKEKLSTNFPVNAGTIKPVILPNDEIITATIINF